MQLINRWSSSRDSRSAWKPALKPLSWRRRRGRLYKRLDQPSQTCGLPSRFDGACGRVRWLACCRKCRSCKWAWRKVRRLRIISPVRRLLLVRCAEISGSGRWCPPRLNSHGQEGLSQKCESQPGRDSPTRACRACASESGLPAGSRRRSAGQGQRGTHLGFDPGRAVSVERTPYASLRALPRASAAAHGVRNVALPPQGRRLTEQAFELARHGGTPPGGWRPPVAAGALSPHVWDPIAGALDEQGPPGRPSAPQSLVIVWRL